MDFSGLKASLGKFELNKNQAGMIYNIEIDKIRPNPNQPRKDFDDGELLELAEDMKRNGLIQPIVVRPDAENPGMFIIVTGERRYRAAKLNSDARIKAVVNEDWKDDEIGYVQMSENLQRSDLKFWELADFIIAHADAGEKQSEIAKKLGIDKHRVMLYMKWKDIPDFIKENKNKLKAIAAAVDLAKLPEDEARKILDETPDGEFVSRAQASKALKPEEAQAEPVSDTAPESSGEASGTEESFTSEPESSSSEAPEGAAESFAESSSDTGTGDSGSAESSDASFFNTGSSDSDSRESSGESEFTGDSGSQESSGSFSESSGTEESFTSESESDESSTESSESESSGTVADSGSSESSDTSDASFFDTGSSGSSSSESADSASGETDSGSSDNSFMFDLDKPADDEFKKPIIYGSVDGREAELLWKKKPQTDGWVVVKYEDGTTEEVLAERYRLNRIYEIN